MQALSGMVVYFIVMNDYGFKPFTLVGMNLLNGVLPNGGDVYNPSLKYYGNTAIDVADPTASAGYGPIAWGSNEGSTTDLRLVYYTLPPSAWSPCAYDPSVDSVPVHWRISAVTHNQICYTSEALFYAQTAYFIATITTQWANCIICKTRALSISQ